MIKINNNFSWLDVKREYATWASMIQRCYNPNDPNYIYYGGRGISVCERWRENFFYFYEDMGPRPIDTTLERKDNNGNYELDNCKWASRREQHRNRKNNRILEFDNKSMCVVDWSKERGINRYTLANRLRNGWSIERALTEKVHRRKPSL